MLFVTCETKAFAKELPVLAQGLTFWHDLIDLSLTTAIQSMGFLVQQNLSLTIRQNRRKNYFQKEMYISVEIITGLPQSSQGKTPRVFPDISPFKTFSQCVFTASKYNFYSTITAQREIYDNKYTHTYKSTVQDTAEPVVKTWFHYGSGTFIRTWLIQSST